MTSCRRRASSLVALVTLLVAASVAAAPPAPAAVLVAPTIQVWYGDVQQVDHLGRSQQWANVLGRVSDPDGTVTSLSFTLNDGPSRPLSIGRAHLRLPRLGDFNVEIDRDELQVGENHVTITAVDDSGLRTARTITLTRSPRSTWPLPTRVDWGGAAIPTEVADVVDGRWSTGSAGVQNLEQGYDRLLAIGDVTWRDYVVEVPVTVHKRHSTNAGVGMLMRWTGHTDAPPHQPGMQPLLGWRPSGALAWYRSRPKQVPRIELARDDESPLAVDTSGFDLTPGVPYVFRASVRRTANGDHYTLAVFPQGADESSGVSLAAVDTGFTKAAGSVLLIAHRMTVTFGAVDVRPLGSTQNEPPFARDDAATVPSGASVDVPVLANDFDVDGLLVPSSIVVVSGPAAGSVAVDPDAGTVRYTAGAGFVGQDFFQYTVADDDGDRSNVATVTLTVSDGSPPASGLVSDEFADTVPGSHWQLVDPRGDASLASAGGQLHLGVPGGSSHDLWTGALLAPRLVQAAADGDFDVEVKADSAVTSRYQMQGVVVQEDPDDLLRFDVHHDGSTPRLFVARIQSGKGVAVANIPTSLQAPYWLRVTRTGSTFTYRVSSDGVQWTTVASFDHALVVSSVGVFAGNHGTRSIPAHTASFDHFRDVGAADGGDGS